MNNLLEIKDLYVNAEEKEILKGLNLKMDNNYIVVDKNMETSVKGIYAAGDIIKKDLYQLVTAVSEGAIAATNVFKSIK